MRSIERLKKREIKIDYIILATGSGGTQADLVAGAKALGTDTKIIGISVSGDKISGQENVSAIANNIAEALGLNFISRENVQRKIVVHCNVAGKDLRSVVNTIESEISSKLDIPSNYYISYGGQFEK